VFSSLIILEVHPFCTHTLAPIVTLCLEAPVESLHWCCAQAGCRTAFDVLERHKTPDPEAPFLVWGRAKSPRVPGVANTVAAASV
jgi:hypothetical protein